LLVGENLLPGGRGVDGQPAGWGRVASVPLPDSVVFKRRDATFSTSYAFLLRAGRIYFRPALRGRGVPGKPWRVLDLPTCLAGQVREISADETVLTVLGQRRQLYSLRLSGSDLGPGRWTWRWGSYFWTGLGLRLWPDVRAWAYSGLDASEWYRDASGRERHPIGVSTAYLLRGDLRRITYIDPWLPNDESREVCGPRRGTVALLRLSASGSTIFVAARSGELFTRMYDFDTSGANTVFGRFSWQPDRPAGDERWQLPGPEWVQHERPRGHFTDRITIFRSGGPHSEDRTLRVAGRDRRGRAGYWTKPIAARGKRAWRFVVRRGVLGGHRLPRKGRSRAFAPADVRYGGSVAGASATIENFNAECSPARMRVWVAPGVALDLVLHTSDALRQETRGRGLDDIPREYNGAIEVPRGVWETLRPGDPRKAWIDAQLGGQRVAVAPVAATATRLRFLRQCWTLTLDGRPARPDRLRIPPDLGAIVARLAEQGQDGWTPRC
jgi:hypothetical protein